MMADEFYVGYRKKMGKDLAKWLRLRLLGVAAVVLGLLVVFLIFQRPFYFSKNEYKQYQNLEGIVFIKPYPHLAVPRPGVLREMEAYSRYLLVSPNKFGAMAWANAYDGQWVQLKGAFIYRDNQAMVEALPDSVSVLSDRVVSPNAMPINRPIGKVTLKGEIVDSKCFFGAMNPGHFKVHRACAVQCVRGGIPPILVVQNMNNRRFEYYLLLDEQGNPINDHVLDVIAEPLRVTGDLAQVGEWMVLKIDRSGIKRLAP